MTKPSKSSKQTNQAALLYGIGGSFVILGIVVLLLGKMTQLGLSTGIPMVVFGAILTSIGAGIKLSKK